VEISWTQDGSTGVLGPDLVAGTADVGNLHDALLSAFADAESVVCDLSGTIVEVEPAELAGAVAGAALRVADWPAATLTVVSARDDVRELLSRPPRAPGLAVVADLAAAAQRRRPPGVVRWCRSRLEPMLRAPALARAFLRSTLDGWPAAGYRDDAMVVVDELVANAVLHAGSEIELRLALQPDRLGIAVADRDPARPAVNRAGDGAESGRGMLLVDALARSWHVLPRRGGGKVVRAVLAAAPAGGSEDGVDVTDPPVRPPAQARGARP
jgi:hypothetical protein